jgi:mannose-6-phosphate isomerase-like protein (cupin superfamily)
MRLPILGSLGVTVGDDTIEVRAGQIVVAPAGVPHMFVNSGIGPLRQVDIQVDASNKSISQTMHNHLMAQRLEALPLR